MADSTINGLTAITGANVDNTADQLAIWDNSDSTTKKITRTELMVGLPAGTAAAPAISFSGDPDTGIYNSSANVLGFAAGGTVKAILTTAQFRIVEGSAGAPSICSLGYTTTGIFWPTTNTLAFSSGGVEAMRINSAQQLLIGVTSSTSLYDGTGATFAPKTISGSVSGVSGLCVTVQDGTNNRRLGLFVDQTNAVMGISSGYSTGAIPFVYRDSTAERFRITTAGLVQIASAGTAAAPAICVGGDTNTGTFALGSDTFGFSTGGVERIRLDANGNVIVNTAAVATTATDGFLYVPSCAGTPTGTPSTYAGRVPIVVDTTNNKLYFYSGGAWRDAGP